jgi:AcrR family transcriptional regulator
VIFVLILSLGGNMMAKKEDRRINRTKKMLREALVSIMENKKLKDISIRELCDYADISRGTFYLHYTDINDMVEKIEDELFEGLNAAIGNNIDKSMELMDTHYIFLDIYKYMAQNATIVERLFGPNGDIKLFNKVKDIVREKCLRPWMQKLGNDTTPILYYLNSFLVSGMMGIIAEWLSGGMQESPQEITDITVKVMRMGGMLEGASPL